MSWHIAIDESPLAKAAERVKAALEERAGIAAKLAAEDSLERIQKPTYWQNGSGRGRRKHTAETFRVVLRGQSAASVESASPVALYLDQGTKPHTISAKPGGVLRFVVNGSVRFARTVHHPGTKAIDYVATEQRLGQRDLEEHGDSELRRALERAGLT